ncbi:MAG: NAD(P)H-hydrate dehydratase [Xylophilus ampelinus]
MQRFRSGHPLPLFGASALRRAEAAASASLPQGTLVRRAGRAVARLAMALAPHARTVWIACGPGNNGADGLEAALCLHASAARRPGGARIAVSCFGAGQRMSDAARDASERARAAGIRFLDAPPVLGAEDLCIDALLGLGARAAPAAGWAAGALALLDRCAPAARLAVDLPTGLDADTGVLAEFARRSGPAAAQARHTLSMLGHKPGLFTADGRDAVGTLWLDDLGLDGALLPEPDAWLAGAPERRALAHASHKGSHGDVLVVGGEHIARRGLGMSGAAVLAGAAALHGGAGRVLACLLGPAAHADDIPFDPLQPELMLRTPEALGTVDLERTTVVCGCGGGEAVAAHLPRLLDGAHRLVLDADALNAVAADRALRESLHARADRPGRHTVLTPHPLEAARLLDRDTAAVQGDRLAAARALAERFRCAAALKGSGTIVCAPGRPPSVNPTGNGRLATAGTGDVLAGLVGARLASGMPAADAASAAVYEHGNLADRWPAHRPLTALLLARALQPY